MVSCNALLPMTFPVTLFVIFQKIHITSLSADQVDNDNKKKKPPVTFQNHNSVIINTA